VISVRLITRPAWRSRRLVDLQISDREHGRRERTRPTRERLDARQQLLESEGFRHVVVGPRPQRGHFRVDGILRREHEHGALEPLRAQ
jgi:hypothetical protein